MEFISVITVSCIRLIMQCDDMEARHVIGFPLHHLDMHTFEHHGQSSYPAHTCAQTRT